MIARSRASHHRLLLLVVLVAAALSWASAQVSVELSPPNARYRAQPGDTLSGTLSLRNTSDGPVSLTAFPSDFVLAADGAIHPLPAASLPTSLTSWLTVNATDVTLPGNSTQDVRYSVTVPPDTQGGTYWAAVLFKTDTPQGPTDASGHNVGIRYVAQLAYVILVDVGDLSPAGKVADISLAQAPSDSQQGQTVQVTFQNTGNAYMLVSGRVEIHQLDGTLVGSYPITRTASLPGELSHLTVEPSPPLPSGHYLATAVLDDGSTNQIAGQAQLDVP